MARTITFLSGLVVGGGLLVGPVPGRAMEDAKTCSIETCTQGGVELIGPGPGDPSLNGIPEPSKGPSGQQKAADQKGDRADKKNQQQAATRPRAPVGPVLKVGNDPVRKGGCGTKTLANCP